MKTLKPAQKAKKPSPKKEKEVEEAPKQKKREVKAAEKEKEKEKEVSKPAEPSVAGDAAKTGLIMTALQAFCTVLQTLSK